MTIVVVYNSGDAEVSMAKMNGTRTDDEEIPIERIRGRREGGCIRFNLRVESSRSIGLDPQDLDSDEQVEFLVSEVNGDDDRLVLDLLGVQAD